MTKRYLKDLIDNGTGQRIRWSGGGAELEGVVLHRERTWVHVLFDCRDHLPRCRRRRSVPCSPPAQGGGWLTPSTAPRRRRSTRSSLTPVEVVSPGRINNNTVRASLHALAIGTKTFSPYTGATWNPKIAPAGRLLRRATSPRLLPTAGALMMSSSSLRPSTACTESRWSLSCTTESCWSLGHGN